MAKKSPPPAVMLNLIIGYWVSRLIYVAAKLELADLLDDGPRTVEELAMAAGVRAPALYRVLRALASVGIFEETKGRHFKLTPLAATLRTHVNGSMRAMAMMMVQNYMFDVSCPLSGARLLAHNDQQQRRQVCHAIQRFAYASTHLRNHFLSDLDSASSDDCFARRRADAGSASTFCPAGASSGNEPCLSWAAARPE